MAYQYKFGPERVYMFWRVQCLESTTMDCMAMDNANGSQQEWHAKNKNKQQEVHQVFSLFLVVS